MPSHPVPFGPLGDRSQRMGGLLEDRGKPDLNRWRRSGKTFPQALKRGSAKSFMSELKLRRHDAIAAELRVGGLTWGRRAFDLGWAFAFTGFAYLRISCVFSTLLVGVRFVSEVGTGVARCSRWVWCGGGAARAGLTACAMRSTRQSKDRRYVSKEEGSQNAESRYRSAATGS